jgi:hypothetical protein
MSDDVDSVVAYCRENRRVCPVPQRWNEFYELLPAKRRVGVGYEPAVPLILSAWWETSDRDKRQRLEVHIRWAHQYGVLETIDAFLRSLPESDWHHAD